MNDIALNFISLLDINILYFIYIMVLLLTILKIKPKIYSFSFIFIFYTFLTYFCGSLIYEFYPELDRYHGNIDKNYNINYSKAFLYL